MENRNARRAVRPAAIEVLEGRRLMSATLDSSGILKVTAPGSVFYTPAANITVTESNGNIAVKGASLQKTTFNFPVGTVRLIWVYGSNSDDYITVNTSRQTEVYGKFGNDYLVTGGTFATTIYKGAKLSGDAGDDILQGYSNPDYLTGGSGNDLLLGGGGNDVLQGDTGDDVLWGESGNDDFYGGLGNDKMYGQSGNDTFNRYEETAGANLIDGGDGFDTAYYSAIDIVTNIENPFPGF